MDKYYKLRDRVEEIQTLAERASFSISEVICDYGYAKNPDPTKAVQFSSERNNSQEARQSFEWFADYDRIFKLLEITCDYLSWIEKLTAEAIKA